MPPALSRMRGADRLVAAGALALALFMFVFDWFGESFGGTLPGSELSGAGTGATGWEAFTVSRWVWLLTVLVALASVFAARVDWRLPGAARPGSLVALLGAVSTLLIAFRIVHHPVANAGFGGFHVSAGIRVGIWLGLVATLTIACGGYLQLRAELPARAPAHEPGDDAFTGLTHPGKPTSGDRVCTAPVPRRGRGSDVPHGPPGDAP